MALTYVEDWATQASASPVTSGSVTITTGDVVTVLFVNEDVGTVGTVSISNSGTALTWNAITTQNAASNTYVRGWYAIAGSTGARTVSVAWTGGNAHAALATIVHTGADGTTPVPSGKVFTGASGHNVTQSITPTATGSALWFIAGDWAATNTFAAATNCTRDQNTNVPGAYTATLIRPTTQPRTDALAFTIGETDTGGTIAWIAFEVVAAAGTTDGSLMGQSRQQFAMGLGA